MDTSSFILSYKDQEDDVVALDTEDDFKALKHLRQADPLADFQITVENIPDPAEHGTEEKVDYPVLEEHKEEAVATPAGSETKPTEAVVENTTKPVEGPSAEEKAKQNEKKELLKKQKQEEKQKQLEALKKAREAKQLEAKL